MTPEASHLKIGIFLTVAIALVIAGISAWGGAALFEKSVLTETYFDESVQGLAVGSAVKYRGVKIGEVEGIAVANDVYGSQLERNQEIRFGRYVVVTMAITTGDFVTTARAEQAERLRWLVASGMRVRLAGQGLTGTKFLEIDYMDPDKNEPLEVPWEPDELYLPSAEGTFTRILESAEKFFAELGEAQIDQTIDDLDAVFVSARQAIEDAKIAQVRADLTELIEHLDGSAARLDRLLADPALDSLSADLAAAAANSRDVTAELSAAELGSTVTALRDLMRDLEQATAELPTAIAQIRQTMYRADGLLTQTERGLDDIVENLRVVTFNLKQFSEDARVYPAGAIFGDPPPETTPGVE